MMALPRRVILGLLALVLFCITGCHEGDSRAGAAAAGSASAKPTALHFAVVPKGTTHEFWKAVHAGAVKASRVAGVTVDWKGPVREDDRDEQVKVVENFVSRGVDGIVIAPLDDRALVPVLRDATARKIPVVVIDSGISWDGYASFVSTDNERAGGLAAEHLGKQLDGKGQVIVMRYQEGSASTMAREKGFIDTLKKKFPQIVISSENQYGGATTESAFSTAESLLSTHADVQGIFCPNESTTFGMLRALQGAQKAGKVHFVGFDASDKLVEALDKGQIDALVVQNPFRMGELGVATLVSHVRGKPVEKRIDTGATLVTKDNMGTPDVKQLLSPDLAAYLE